jgi:hypothetical protein
MMELLLSTLVLTGSVDISVLTDYQNLVRVIANQYDLSNLDVLALILIESNGDPDAVSPIGAVGLLQVMPREHGFPDRPTADELHNPETNIRTGCKILAKYLSGTKDLYKAILQYIGSPDWEKEEKLHFFKQFEDIKEILRTNGFESIQTFSTRDRKRKTFDYYGLSFAWDRHRNDWSGPLPKPNGNNTDSQWSQR